MTFIQIGRFLKEVVKILSDFSILRFFQISVCFYLFYGFSEKKNTVKWLFHYKPFYVTLYPRPINFTVSNLSYHKDDKTKY